MVLSRGVGQIQGVVVAAPVGAGHGRAPIGLVDEGLGMLGQQPRAGQGDEGRHPQARAHAGPADALGGMRHAAAEAVVGPPVPDGGLPAVIDLQGLEAQGGDLRDLLIEGLLGDALVVGVPGAPHALGPDLAAPQRLPEGSGVVAQHHGGRARQDDPLGGTAGLGEGLQGGLVGAQPRRAPRQAAHEEGAGLVLHHRQPGGVVPHRVVPGVASSAVRRRRSFSIRIGASSRRRQPEGDQEFWPVR